MTQFERTESDDALFAAIGRALTFAARFENNCRGLSTLLGLKDSEGDLLQSEERLAAFAKEMERRKLYQHIQMISSGRNDFYRILDKARSARNELAHDFTLGLDEPPADEREVQDLVQHLEGTVTTLADADRWVCILISLITHEPLPIPRFIEEYPRKVVEWVCRIQ